MDFKSETPKNKKNKTVKAGDKKPAMAAQKKVIIIIACVVAALSAATAAGVVYVSSIDEIFPNTYIGDTDVSGMSQTEAMAALDGNFANVYDGKAVKIEMPTNFLLEIAAEDVLVLPTMLDAVNDAWNRGHNANPISNALCYLQSMKSKTTFDYSEQYAIDETALRAVAENVALEIQLALMGNDLVVGEDSIRVMKGASAVKVDAEEIYALAVSLFEQRNFEPTQYSAEIATDEDMDLQEVYDSIFCEAQDAYFDGETDEIVPHVVGMSFDIEKAQSKWDNASYGETIEIEVIKTEPEITTEYLESILFRDTLSYKATTLRGSSANRINNVKKACESINGIVLMPGEEFSYNDALGERTPENGYLMAGAYNNGEVVSEYGGGICQVSSTLYYCSLYANLATTYRVCHMFPVAYIESGLDATVSWGGPEFKFRNSRTYPVKINSWVNEEDNTCVVEILGTDTDGTYVQMYGDSWAVFDEEFEEVEIGYKVQTYRLIFDASGNRISTLKESLSYYAYHPEDIEWPSPTIEPTPTPETTPEPTPEVTPEMTPEVVPEATPEIQNTPAPEVTPQPEDIPETPNPDEPVGE